MSVGRRWIDPDARLLRWGWLAFAAWTLIGGAQLIRAWPAGGEAMVGLALAAPAWALWLLWLLWRGLVALRVAARHRAYGRWQGSYFEFEGRQVRIVFDEDDLLIAAEDVFDVLDVEPRRRTPERVRLLAGRDGLIDRGDCDVPVFTERGLRAWMERRSDPAAVRFRRWFEAVVVDPRRRWRERGKTSAEATQAPGRKVDQERQR